MLNCWYFALEAVAQISLLLLLLDVNVETFDGTLVVAGQTTINDSLIIQSNNEVLNINNGSGVTKFSVDTDNGNTNIIGTLTVGDATQINDTLGASGVVTFTRNTQQTLTGSYHC